MCVVIGHLGERLEAASAEQVERDVEEAQRGEARQHAREAAAEVISQAEVDQRDGAQRAAVAHGAQQRHVPRERRRGHTGEVREPEG